MTLTTLDHILAAAQLHLGKGDMVSSACLSLKDAVGQRDAGNFRNAASHARRSLEYSLGIHDEAVKQARQVEESIHFPVRAAGKR